MSVGPPPMDLRSFDELMHDAEAHIRARCPDWTDFSPADPGRTLVELFAFMTETLIWRANRMPRRAWHEFFRMVGMQVQPAGAARAMLEVRRAEAGDRLTLPAGTRILAATGEGVLFATIRPLVLEPGERTGQVPAVHADRIEAERLGLAAGRPGESFTLARGPLVAPQQGLANPEIGVSRPDGAAAPDDRAARLWRGQIFDLWQEVAAFDPADPARRAFRVDRMTGLVQFAPALRAPDGSGQLDRAARAPAEVPPAGAEIRAWYWVGGGESGNLPAGALSRLETELPGVTVSNPEPAAGGRRAEEIENALARAPQLYAAGGRAVTADDYCALAAAMPGVARALAQNPADRWHHAQPGGVVVDLVPRPGDSTASPTRATFTAAASEETRRAVEAQLDSRRPLGARIRTRWARLKPVRIHLRLAADPLADPAALRTRLAGALDQMLSPVGRTGGWAFGAALRTWHVGQVLRSEPAILYSEDPVLEAVETPSGLCPALACDGFEPGVWYVAHDNALFRSVDDGAGWERLCRFEAEAPVIVATPEPWHDPARFMGLVAIVTRQKDAAGNVTGGSIRLSRDCGESWDLLLRFDAVSQVHDLDFLSREGRPTLLLACADGLRELTPDAERNWRRIPVDPGHEGKPAWAVATAPNPPGSASRFTVIVALEGRGLYHSARDGLAASYRAIGPRGQEGRMFRTLKTHVHAGRARVWAGIRLPGGAEDAPGCFEYPVTGEDAEPAVIPHFEGWNGESCRDIAFMDSLVLAATHGTGVHILDLSQADMRWRPASVECGLPQRNIGQLQPIAAIAARAGRAMAAPERLGEARGGGIYASDDGRRWELVTDPRSRGRITLPPDWLFCSAEAGHRIEILPAGADGPAEDAP